jgi:hypothetical protein
MEGDGGWIGEIDDGPSMLAMSEETLMILPIGLRESAGRKCFEVRNGP